MTGHCHKHVMLLPDFHGLYTVCDNEKSEKCNYSFRITKTLVLSTLSLLNYIYIYNTVKQFSYSA